MEIEIKNISKSFSKKTVLNNLSFTACSGKCVGILGENGSGKSTLFGVLTGLSKGEGEFLCDGVDLMQEANTRTQKVGFVPQSPPLIGELTAKDNLLLWYSGNELKKELADGKLSMLGIDEFLKVPVNKMSGGMKKRLSIGCTIANAPEILFLDEPSSALDLVCKQQIYSYLENFKAAGGIVVIATHDVFELDFCDEIYLLKNGTLTLFEGERRLDRFIGHLKDE